MLSDLLLQSQYGFDIDLAFQPVLVGLDRDTPWMQLLTLTAILVSNLVRPVRHHWWELVVALRLGCGLCRSSVGSRLAPYRRIWSSLS